MNTQILNKSGITQSDKTEEPEKIGDNDIFALFEKPEENIDNSNNQASTEIEQIGSQTTKSQKEILPLEKDLFKQKQFFRRLCYAPIWKLDTITNPSELIFVAELNSNFLLKIETGIHRMYQDSLKDFVTIRVFDMDKRVELKQISKTIHRSRFFADSDEQRTVIAYVDSLPLHFGFRPLCSRCNQQFDLINPMNRNSLPFWAHSTRKNNGKSETKPECRQSEVLWGEFPNVDNR